MAVMQTTYGPIRREDGVCKDDYGRLVTYDQPGGAAIVLQRAAMRSFQIAEERYGRKLFLPGMPKKVRQRVDPEVWGANGEAHPNKTVRETGFRVLRPIILTGSIRSCETAHRLYFSAENQKRIKETGTSRYARPEATLHPHGLAIDVHTGWLNIVVRTLLFGVGWKQSRPEDEPWHFSYGFTG